MPDDVTIPANRTVRFDEESAPRFGEARNAVTLTTLGGLVEQQILDSDQELRDLIDAATNTTRAALADVDVHRARRFVPGLMRPDLGRFPRMLAALPTVDRTKVSTFWRVVREVDPALIAAGRLSTDFVLDRPPLIAKWIFNDVTVDAGATLVFAEANAALFCRNLLIRPNGRILATGKSLQITATTIKGE